MKGHKKKPNAKKPYISKDHLILDNQLYDIKHDTVRIPTEPTRYIFIKLTRYVCEKIMGTKLGNVTMTDDKLIISYSKNVTQQRPSNFIGVDRNLDNVTTCDSQGKYVVHDLSKIQKIITSYSTVKSRFRRNDSRIRQDISKIW
ncbi:MAG: hypothetical protein KGI05_01565 [Thaumarchaeota archaeon]|nr:hypothetical protein [Nitrososphaerota archaeon]